MVVDIFQGWLFNRQGFLSEEQIWRFGILFIPCNIYSLDKTYLSLEKSAVIWFNSEWVTWPGWCCRAAGMRWHARSRRRAWRGRRARAASRRAARCRRPTTATGATQVPPGADTLPTNHGRRQHSVGVPNSFPIGPWTSQWQRAPTPHGTLSSRHARSFAASAHHHFTATYCFTS